MSARRSFSLTKVAAKRSQKVCSSDSSSACALRLEHLCRSRNGSIYVSIPTIDFGLNPEQPLFLRILHHKTRSSFPLMVLEG